MDLSCLSVRRARAGLLAGEFTCAEYVDALLQRSEQLRKLNAWVAQDAQAVRDAACHADATGQARDPSLPLGGIPIAIKDNIDVAGLTCFAGTGALRGRTPARNAAVVTRLLQAGAIVAGKTGMHELAMGITGNNRLTGPVRNPYDCRRSAGGSSGGSACAVATGMAPAALGSDTGGSVRLPAALCGVAGLRPTVGRYPSDGVIPLSRSRDTVGPIAGSIDDLMLLDAVLTANTPMQPRNASPVAGNALKPAGNALMARGGALFATDNASVPSRYATCYAEVASLPKNAASLRARAAPLHHAHLRSLRLGLPRATMLADLDGEVATLFETTLQALARAGVTLVEADVPGQRQLTAAASYALVLYEFARDLPAFLAHDRLTEDGTAKVGTNLSLNDIHAGIASPDVASILADQLGADPVTAKEYRNALNQRQNLQVAYAEYFRHHQLDAMVFPTTVLPAPFISEEVSVVLNGRNVPTFATYVRNTDPGSLAGLPGITLPMGLVRNLPVGLALDGPVGSDRQLLATALHLEHALAHVPAQYRAL